MTPDEVDWAIREAVLGRLALTDADLQPILAHVAAVGFDASARERVRGELAGVRWQGEVQLIECLDLYRPSVPLD
jgi:hypothetical protein